MDKELEALRSLERASTNAEIIVQNVIGVTMNGGIQSFPRKSNIYIEHRNDFETIRQALINKNKTEQVLGIILELLGKCCKIELIDGKTYYQIQIRVMHSDYTFGMSITKEEYALLKEMLSDEV